MPDTIPPLDGGPEEADAEFERWARVSARLLRRTVAERAQVLSESGIAGVWPDIDSRWFEALAEDIDAGRLERVDRYAELCAAEIAERAGPESEPPEPLGKTLDVVVTEDADDAEDPPHSSTPPLGRPEAEPEDPSTSLDDIEIDVDVSDERTGEVALAAALGSVGEALDWPVEKYAWLCAELEQNPDRAEQVWTAHGLDDRMRKVVAEAWGERLNNDARLKTQHRSLVTRFRKILQT